MACVLHCSHPSLSSEAATRWSPLVSTAYLLSSAFSMARSSSVSTLMPEPSLPSIDQPPKLHPQPCRAFHSSFFFSQCRRSGAWHLRGLCRATSIVREICRAPPSMAATPLPWALFPSLSMLLCIVHVVWVCLHGFVIARLCVCIYCMCMVNVFVTVFIMWMHVCVCIYICICVLCMYVIICVYGRVFMCTSVYVCMAACCSDSDPIVRPNLVTGDSDYARCALDKLAIWRPTHEMIWWSVSVRAVKTRWRFGYKIASFHVSVCTVIIYF